MQITTELEKKSNPAQTDGSRSKDKPSFHQKKPSSLRRKIAHIGLAAGVTVAGVGAAFEAYQNIPVVQEGVNEVLARLGIEIPVPNTFDNKVNRGAIGNNNILPLSSSEIKNQFPEQYIVGENTLTFLSPFQLQKGTRANYERNLSERLPSNEALIEAQKKGVKDYADFIFPKDTIIIVPVTGHTAVGYGIATLGEDPKKAYGFTTVFYDQTSATTYLIKVYSVTKGSPPLNPLTGIPRFEDNKYFSGTGWKELPMLTRGMPIMQTTADNQLLRLSVTTYKGEEIGPWAKEALSVITPQFFVEKVNGVEKLTTLSSNPESKGVTGGWQEPNNSSSPKFGGGRSGGGGASRTWDVTVNKTPIPPRR